MSLQKVAKLNAMADVNLTIEQTKYAFVVSHEIDCNMCSKLRASLGLKPLRDDSNDGSKEPSAQTTTKTAVKPKADYKLKVRNAANTMNDGAVLTLEDSHVLDEEAGNVLH